MCVCGDLYNVTYANFGIDCHVSVNVFVAADYFETCWAVVYYDVSIVVMITAEVVCELNRLLGMLTVFKSPPKRPFSSSRTKKTKQNVCENEPFNFGDCNKLNCQKWFYIHRWDGIKCRKSVYFNASSLNLGEIMEHCNSV